MASDALPPEVLDDLVDLLAGCAAFFGVHRDQLTALAGAAEIGYVASAGPPVTPAFVVQRGGVVIRQGDHTVDMVARGEFCAPDPDETLDPVEPSLVAWLPERAIDLAWSAPPEQLQQIIATPQRSRIDLQTAPVGTVMGVPIRTAAADESCTAVARMMTDRRISSVVVIDGTRTGIATDRDLRSRLIGQALSSDTPIGAIATFPVRTVTTATPVFDALIEMLATGIHHLPVTDGGRLVGMLSSTDVLELGTRSPLHLRAALDHATDIDDTAAAVQRLPATVEMLLAAGTTAGDCGRVVATVTDRVQRRLLELAFAEHGDPPEAYGWIAFGSQGRREQTLHSDQDHGLVLPDGSDADAHDWWSRVSAWMVDALERCGYPRCAGGVMASRDVWRHEVSGWQSAFAAWIREPSGQHLLDSSIAFDLRTVAGTLHTDRVLGPTIATAADNTVFLARLAREAVRHRPPLGFFGRFAVERSGEHAGSFDVKAGTMLPIADLARLHTLAHGGGQVSTDERLTAAAAEGLLSDDLAATLRAGYELATGLRLRGHVRQHHAGQPLDNWLDPGELEALARAQLRETFKAIRTAQQVVDSRYRTGMLG